MILDAINFAVPRYPLLGGAVAGEFTFTRVATCPPTSLRLPHSDEPQGVIITPTTSGLVPSLAPVIAVICMRKTDHGRQNDHQLPEA